MTLRPTLADAATRWIAGDVDRATAEELQQVLDAAKAGDEGAAAELDDRMATSLTFGTAGLRGRVRAGTNGMNRAVVIRTTAGVAQWLTANGHGGGTVLVGRDARHGSAEFAVDAAAVLAAAGFDAQLVDGVLPTPVLAAAVLRTGAVAGVQITASHNPAGDNGYKLYDASGAQIVPPDDAAIESAIAAAPAAGDVPRAQPTVLDRADVVDPYLRRAAAVARGTDRELRIAVSALYGVGGDVVAHALRLAGFTDVHLVQDEPDPDFGGMALPNPEEPGACDTLLARATAIGADLAVALDPDADRCALGIDDGDGFRMLRGDETGVLLGEYVLSTSGQTDPLVATTIVSSSMLSSIATAHGARYAETYTGFKWLARAGDGLVFAYEEALGVCVDPTTVRDKDGISAAVLAADLAASRRARGSSLAAALAELAVAHGVHRTDQVSLRVDGLPVLATLMRRLRADPPEQLAGVDVAVTDLAPEADVLRLSGEGVRVIVRPSGTEPKLKAYLQLVQPVAGSLRAAEATADERVGRLRRAVEAALDAAAG